MSPQFGLPGAVTEVVDRIESNARVVFIGACDIGPEFLSLWNIDAGTTNRALIVPEGTDTNTNLYAAALAWNQVVDSLGRQRTTVQKAVEDANVILGLDNVPETELRFRVIGGRNVRLR